MPSDPSPDSETRRQAQTREVGNLIRAARKRARLTQAGLAYRMTQMGVPTSRGQVSMWETKQMPGAYKLIAIIRAAVAAMPTSTADQELDDVLDALGRLGQRNDGQRRRQRGPS
jgi:transcriptional regulator with XRE-family HTH domain